MNQCPESFRESDNGNNPELFKSAEISSSEHSQNSSDSESGESSIDSANYLSCGSPDSNESGFNLDPRRLEELRAKIAESFNRFTNNRVGTSNSSATESYISVGVGNSSTTIDPTEHRWRETKEIASDSSGSSLEALNILRQNKDTCKEMSRGVDKATPDHEKIGWKLDAVIEHYLSDAEIAESLDERDFQDAMVIDLGWVEVIKKALEYQGFDPIVIIKTMINNRKAFIAKKAQAQAHDMSNVVGDFKKTANSLDKNLISNESPMMRDIVLLLMVFQARSSHISKVVKKSYAAMSQVLALLMEKYDINDEVRASGTQMASKVVTLPRIAACFPTTSVTLFHFKKAKFIVSLSSFPECDGRDDLSSAICCPLLVSVCPVKILSKDGNNLHPLMFWLAVKVDDIIHKKKKNFTDLSSLFQYYKASFKSTATPEKARMEMFCNLGLLTQNSKEFKPSLCALSVECLKDLNTMRLDDPDHALVIKALKERDME